MQDDPVQSAIETICDRLSERTATLFLGAGVNAGVKDPEGVDFPLGQGLSDWVARDLLASPGLNAPLEEVAEIARYKFGERELNRYIYERFTRFKPGTAHLAIVQIPWDVVYTTNYDLLLEAAAQAPSVEAIGDFKQVLSIDTDVTRFSDRDILYYKLHGSIDMADTPDGRLTLTKEDYRHYDRYRKPLFKRLERDLQRRTFVFVGYSLRDDNLRAILEECRDELGGRALPLSFAVRQQFTEVEETFWREKYNIQFVQADAALFLNRLKETWIQQNRSVVQSEQRRSRVYVQADESTRFQRVGESFFQVRAADCTGPSNAKWFFDGAEPSWGAVRDKVPPYRDMYWTLMEAIFPELAEPSIDVSVYLMTGAAGTGKTTLLRSAAFDLAYDFDLPVLIHIPDTPLDARFISPLVNETKPHRIIVIVRHAGQYVREVEQFLEDCRRRRLPVTILLEERKNQWSSATEWSRTRLAPPEFELGPLSPREIDEILDALARHNALGRLTGASQEYKVAHFTALAHKELLVALRELTTGEAFDKIIRDEFKKIPSAVGREAYKYAAALGQQDLDLRYEVLVHLLDLRYDQLGSEVLTPTEGVLLTGEVTGYSRHNVGFRVRTRHPIIASVIFALVAPDDEAKFEIFNAILSTLDPGFPEDLRLLNEITRRRELVNTLASKDMRRAVYDRLSAILPDNAFVWQHRSILERELGNAEAAIDYARKARQLDKNNPTIQNTLGMALEHAARDTDDPLLRQARESEAASLFEEGLRRDPADPYGYLGKFFLLKQRIGREQDKSTRDLLEADGLSLLEDAYELTDESVIIAGELAKQRERLGTPTNAIELLQNALAKRPSNTRLRDLLVRYLADSNHTEEALKIALEDTKFDPTSWRLQRHIARLKRNLGHPVDAVKGYYEAAIRHHKGDVVLMVELAAYLFMNGRYPEARPLFSQARDLPITSMEKKRIRTRWKDVRGRVITFNGKVTSVGTAQATALAIPDNFEAPFWRDRSSLSALGVDARVRFTVSFNAFGPLAEDVMPELAEDVMPEEVPT